MTIDLTEETITIPLKEYIQLQKDSDWLYFLECVGVDNWEGFDEARQLQEDDENFGTN